MKIAIITLGCKVNQYESGAIKEELLKILPSQNKKGEKFEYLTFLDFPNLTSPE